MARTVVQQRLLEEALALAAASPDWSAVVPPPKVSRNEYDRSLLHGLTSGRPIQHPGQGVLRCPECFGETRHVDDCPYGKGRLLTT